MIGSFLWTLRFRFGRGRRYGSTDGRELLNGRIEEGNYLLDTLFQVNSRRHSYTRKMMLIVV